jgi:hypothetical protein
VQTAPLPVANDSRRLLDIGASIASGRPQVTQFAEDVRVQPERAAIRIASSVLKNLPVNRTRQGPSDRTAFIDVLS